MKILILNMMIPIDCINMNRYTNGWMLYIYNLKPTTWFISMKESKKCCTDVLKCPTKHSTEQNKPQCNRGLNRPLHPAWWLSTQEPQAQEEKWEKVVAVELPMDPDAQTQKPVQARDSTCTAGEAAK